MGLLREPEEACLREGWVRQGRQSRPLGEASCLPTLCSLQTDKERLTEETKELLQKVKYLQDQLSPLSRQRDYQEKEIQRLNKVGALALVPWAGRASLSPPAMPTPSRVRVTLSSGGATPGSWPWRCGLGAASWFPSLCLSLRSR